MHPEVSKHYKEMAKKRHEKNKPPSEFYRAIQKKSVEKRLKNKAQKLSTDPTLA